MAWHRETPKPPVMPYNTLISNQQMTDNLPTKKEVEYKICILDLLIAIDDDIVDWRGYRELWIAIQKADIALDIWAGMNLKQIKEETEAYLRGMKE